MLSRRKGLYGARFAITAQDLTRAQALRYLAFRAPGPAGAASPATGTGPAGIAGQGHDADEFDPLCCHMLIEEQQSGTLVCCFRLLLLPDGTRIGTSYSAQFYDLAALQRFADPMAELGRFCIHPDWHDPDILRVAWAALTAYVDAERIGMLFGCSSFQGTKAEAYRDTFALLNARYLAPERWSPCIKAPDVFRFAEVGTGSFLDMRRALVTLPPLLRTYLTMGGWVSDHAVIDHDLQTLHVFTGLEISAVPSARARALRILAA